MTAYILNLVDLAFTLHAISNGVRELNPLLQSVPFTVIYKVAVVGGLCWWLSQQKSSLARCGLVALTVVYGAVCIWHIINIL